MTPTMRHKSSIDAPMLAQQSWLARCDARYLTIHDSSLLFKAITAAAAKEVSILAEKAVQNQGRQHFFMTWLLQVQTIHSYSMYL